MSTHYSSPDALSLQINREAYLNRVAERVQRIAFLNGLLEGDEKLAILKQLHSAGYKFEQDFQVKSAEEMKAAIRELIAVMEGFNREILDIKSKVNNEAKQVSALPEITELSQENAEWLNRLVDTQYGSAKGDLEVVLDGAKGETAPSMEAIKASILKTLTNEQVAEFKKLREPTLLIVPDTTSERMKAGINKAECKKIPGQTDAYLDPWFKDTLDKTAAHFGVAADQAKISTYRFAICEGKQHFDAQAGDHDKAWNEKAKMKNEDRIKAFQNYCSNNKMESMNAPGYMMLMIKYLRAGKKLEYIDDSNWNFTILPGEPLAAHVKVVAVACGRWDRASAQAHFNFYALTSQRETARLRASVMGKIT